MPRWYVDNVADTANIVVPVELVLHASFEMELAVLPPRGASLQQRQGVRDGAEVLAEADHDARGGNGGAVRQRHSDQSSLMSNWSVRTG